MNIDLTRWSRSGLKRLQYTNGNAATYFSLLRSALARRFNHTDTRWNILEETLVDPDDDDRAINQRILDFYSAENNYDIAVELGRTFARGCHILTEHINAYANENYLATATQWENIRRMVAMLDYHPSPPASATTQLVLHAKDSRVGAVAKGELQVKYTPIDGSSPVVFENLEDIFVDPLNNELRLKGWDRSSENFDPFSLYDAQSEPIWQTTADTKLSVGQLGVLVSDCAQASSAQVIRISKMISNGNYGSDIDYLLSIQLTPVEVACGQDTLFQKGFTRLLTAAGDTIVPHLNGEDVIQVDRPHNLIHGDVLAWYSDTGWSYGKVSAVDNTSLEISGLINASADASLPKAHQLLHKTFLMTRNSSGDLDVPNTVGNTVYVDSGGQLALLSNDSFELLDEGGIETGAKRLERNSQVSEVYALTDTPALAGRVVARAIKTVRFDGKPGKISSGDWLIAALGSTQLEQTTYRVLRVREVLRYDNYFDLVFDDFLSAANPTATTEIVTLTQVMQRLQMTLVNSVFRDAIVDDVASGSLQGASVSIIKGIGSECTADLRREFGESLTVSDLAEMAPTQRVSGISVALLWEFIGKAQVIQSLAFFVPEEVRGRTLSEIVDMILAGFAGGDASVNLVANAPAQKRIVRVYANFQEKHRPLGHDNNATSLAERSAFNNLVLQGSSFSPYLKAGRRLVLQKKMAEHYSSPVTCSVAMFSAPNHLMLKDLPENIRNMGFTQGNLVISANVVRSGHGVKREIKVLGSGNAASLNQSFVLEVDDIAFIVDPTMPKGVRADIDVFVVDQVWYQVASLKDAGLSDPSYEVRMTEEKYLRIHFGDGVNGRRLPTGTNNIRVRFRSGHGLRGNLPKGALNKLAKPNRYIDTFQQPYPSDGGNDMEDVLDIKTNAPTSILTIERAVSLADFANLAQSQASVWQARAVRKSNSRGTLGRVKVIVIPAGGLDVGTTDSSNLSLPSDFSAALKNFLLAHAQPGVDIELVAYVPILANITISPYVISAEYEYTVVADAVKAALLSAFGLKQRQLGQALYLSEIYKIVESVPGVEYSVCSIAPTFLTGQGGSDEVIHAATDQVIYVDEFRGSVIDVSVQEYEL